LETIEELKRRIQSTEDLQSVVKTMKSLAAVKIRQFQQAVESLEDFNDTIKMALRIVLRSGPGLFIRERDSAEKDRIGCVVFGSDQGMCGQLNDQVASEAIDLVERFGVQPDNLVLAAGYRAAARLHAQGQNVAASFSMPGSVEAITDKVEEILFKIEELNDAHGIETIYLFHARPAEGASYRIVTQRLLPVDRSWLQELEKDPWPTRMLPLFTMDREVLFSELIQQYLFAALFRAFAESLASENASRLASMQGAERNIRDRLGELNNRYHQQRQMSITAELLDIVSGFEALEGEEGDSHGT
jgi:F-type H+-transporting ATPase subunit gamma